MIELRIEAMKKRLNHLLEKGADFDSIYELSKKLDRLIVLYYVRNGYGMEKR
jgi:hypothetical protein